MNKVSQVKTAAPILSGLLYAFVCMGVATLVVSLLLTLSGMKENSLSLYAYFIHGLSISIGGFVCGKRTGVKGWYYGGLCGVVYSIVIILIAFLGFDAGLGLPLLVLPLLSFAMGALGGMIGVNARK